ncbi:50S ribosomal protein L11 methyltransferase [Alkaliphilus crotonatoxidans]
MMWIEVSIKTTTEAVEAVSNILYDAGVSGVAIEDPNDFVFEENNELIWDYVDESILPTNFEGAIVKGYLPASADLVDKVELIKELVGMLPQYGLDIGLGEVTTIEVSEDDWSDAWKQYYKPTKIGERVVVKPTWEQYEPAEEDIIIELDPGMAFGTGTHETTMMCVMELEQAVKPHSIVFDIGCGSGILAIAAAKIGAERVTAIDLDPVAKEVAEKNVSLNHVEDIVEVKQGNLTDALTGKAHVVVANIIADIITLLSKDITNFIEKNGIFISSGIILEKIDMVVESLKTNGFEVVKVNKMGEWAAIVAQYKGE